MSTKVLVSQMAWGYLVAKAVANELADAKEKLRMTQQTIEDWLRDQVNAEGIIQLADRLRPVRDLLLLGTGSGFQVVREGMIKIIEGAYMHAHAVPAGDLKHYAITLIEPGVPVIALVHEDENKKIMDNAIHEVLARGAEVIGIGQVQDMPVDIGLTLPYLPETQALMSVLPLQLLAYYLAVFKGNDVDKPRNIAKSVTVK
jgi:glucosamine--fructose-6-phosphate aminotransferase (isomerizing)